MKRLIKKAEKVDIKHVQKILKRVDEASDKLKDIYYVMFDNLNALYEAYPDLYKQIEMVVKLPSNKEAINVVKFNEDLHDILEHMKDEGYLNSYVNPEEELKDPDMLEGLEGFEEIDKQLNSEMPEIPEDNSVDINMGQGISEVMNESGESGESEEDELGFSGSGFSGGSSEEVEIGDGERDIEETVEEEVLEDSEENLQEEEMKEEEF